MNINTLMQDYQHFHSEFQQDFFIITHAGGFTAYGQYIQTLRELNKRLRGLNEIENDIEILKIEIEELQTTLDDSFQGRKNKIELNRKQFNLAQSENVLRDTRREYEHFLKRAKFLKEIVGDLTPERREQLEMDMWRSNLKRDAALDMLAEGRIGRATIDSIMCCPQEIRGELLDIIRNPNEHNNLIAWYENNQLLIEG